MKFNLKNRPRTDVRPQHAQTEIEIQIEKWFEDFEKELREIRKSARNLSLDEGSDVVPDLIKEILGEG